MLESYGKSLRKTADQTRHSRTLFGHGDEYFAWLLIWIKANRDVALMPGNAEFVSDRLPLIR
jgi:hypothetical protein